MFGIPRLRNRGGEEHEAGTLKLDKPILPRRVAITAANQDQPSPQVKVRSQKAGPETAVSANDSRMTSGPRFSSRLTATSRIADDLVDDGSIEAGRSSAALPLVEQACDLPPHKDVLSKFGGSLAISAAMQIKMAAVLLSEREVGLICIDGFQESDAFRTLANKVEREGFVVSRRMRGTTSVISGLHDIDVRRNSARNSAEVVDGRNSPAVGYLTEVIRDAVAKGATDVHISMENEASVDRATIKFRVHTKMRVQRTHLSREQVEEMITVAYQFCNEEGSTSATTWNPMMNPSAMIKVELGQGVRIRLRMQCNKVVGGYHVVYRILHDESGKAVEIKSLKALGYSDSQIHDINIATRSSAGMTLISGVTGSGKSTTLKTILAHHPYKEDIEIYSVEDPVEYRIPGVHQISVQRSANEVLQSNRSDIDPFQVAVKNLLRSDPDAAMLGEIRDEFTAESAASLVDTGHQVYGTVHADSWSGTVGRLASRNIGLHRDRMLGSSFFSALLYQKLVPVLCQHCKRPAEGNLDHDLLSEIARFGINTSDVATLHPQGCEQCSGLGTTGMTVVAEVVLPDSELRGLLAAGKDIEAYNTWRSRRSAGFGDPNCDSKTAFEHAIYKMSKGIVDPRDIESTFYPFARHEIVGQHAAG